MEASNKNNKYTPTKKEKKLAVFITLFAVIVLGGITYTFFSAAVSNTNNEKVQTQTATMSLEFDDNDNGVSGTLNLGQSIIKKFTLENTGTVDAYGQINWYNLVNTYTQDSLNWTLEQSTTENGTYTTIGTGKVPISSSGTTKKLKSGILVPVSTTYYYKLTITLNNLDINQSSDINASMHSQFSLVSSSEPGANTILNLVSGEPSNTTNVITKPSPTGETCTNTLAYDGTVDNNLRYVGADPCNYVTFNGETAGWRIVGVMNNVDDGTENLETRIKLIRATSLGSYSWDTSDSSINSGYGINDWTQADLMYELNGDYLDTTLSENTVWYDGINNKRESIFDITKRLSSLAQNLIENTKWNLGGYNTSDIPASVFYNVERDTRVYDGNPTEWTGKIALIYPSDYGFAVGGNGRNICLSKNLSDYYDNRCYNNNWLFFQHFYHLLSPESDNSVYVFSLGDSVNSTNAFNNSWVHPSLFLKSDISIIRGNGSVSEPYVIN